MLRNSPTVSMAALVEISYAARDLFRQGFDIFESRDIDRARDLEAGNRVDLLYSEALNLAVNPTNKEKAGSSEWRVRAALTVHYLERIAEHGVNIGKRAVLVIDTALTTYQKGPFLRHKKTVDQAVDGVPRLAHLAVSPPLSTLLNSG